LNRAERMRFRATGRADPLFEIDGAIDSCIFCPPSAAFTDVNAVYGEIAKSLGSRMLTFVYVRLRTCTLSGMECRNKPGAQHRTRYFASVRCRCLRLSKAARFK